MKCPQCGYGNVEGARFCARCGSPLGQAQAPVPAQHRCPQCGFDNKAGALFCARCGSPLGQGQPAAQYANPSTLRQRQYQEHRQSAISGARQAGNSVMRAATTTAQAVKKTYDDNRAAEERRREEGLRCPKCGSHHVAVQVIQTSARTKNKNKGIGLGGHINNAARGVVAVGTLGLSNLVWKKSEGTERGKTTYKTETVCVCQHCGATFSRWRGMR